MSRFALLLALALTGCASTPLTTRIEYPDGKPLQSAWGQRDLWHAYCEALALDGDLDGAHVARIVVYRRDTLTGVPGIGAMAKTIPEGKLWAGACRYRNDGRAALYFARWHWALKLMRHELHHARLWRQTGLARVLLNQRHGHPSWQAIEEARGAPWPKTQAK